MVVQSLLLHIFRHSCVRSVTCVVCVQFALKQASFRASGQRAVTFNKKVVKLPPDLYERMIFIV